MRGLCTVGVSVARLLAVQFGDLEAGGQERVPRNEKHLSSETETME